MARKTLVACGLIASILYIAMNVFVPMGWPAYNSSSRTISEWSAIDAPTRPIGGPLAVAWTAASERRASSARSLSLRLAISLQGSGLKRPAPVPNRGHVLAVAPDVLPMLDEALRQRLFHPRRAGTQLRQPVERIARQVKAVQIV